MASRRAHIRSVALASVALIAAFATPLFGQDDGRPIDRWLVTHVAPIPGGSYPLESDGPPQFPDRDLTIGPGYWSLLRNDGSTDFDLTETGERPADATTTLAHAYLKAPHDLTAGLFVEGPECADTRAWLNGQPLSDMSGEAPIRLAAGWNSLLVSLAGNDRDCAPRLSAALSGSEIPVREDEDPADLGLLVVQASRPPGARVNHPDGVLLLENPIPIGLTWRAGEDQLLTTISYSVTAWGGVTGLGRLSRAGPEIPEGPPTVDLTGEWAITFYTPTGIQTSRSTLEMSEDGTLTGRVEGERLDGEIRDGWVSGDEFGWRMRFGGRGRDLQLGIRGVLADDRMSGALDFGGFRDFEARFEGERVSSDMAEGEEEASTGEEETPTGEQAAADPVSEETPDAPDAAPDADELDTPADPDGQRAQIVRQLLPPPARPPAAAPSTASIELDISGGELKGAFEGLEPLLPQSGSGAVRFRQARSAALDDQGFEARLRWNDDAYDFVGRVPAGALLEVLHERILLDGWGLAGADGFAGTFRVPPSLDGFTLRVGDGEWAADGAPLEGRLLCQPCSGGDRYDITVSGTETPTVQIVDPGFPQGRDAADAPAADAWLEALRGDNERYRELGRRFG
jgi:hypothetical protein